MGGSTTMTVCTNNIALRHLFCERPPAPVAQTSRDAEGFVGSVVELKDDWVGLPAVHARVSSEELHEEGRSL
jgi:hypothetical protein